MTKRKLLTYLQTNRELLNLSAIAKEAKVNRSVFANWIGGGNDGHGTPHDLPDKYIEPVVKVLKRLKV